MIEGLFVSSFELELMASGFVGPTVGRLTCRGGKNPVRSFQTPKSCPLLLRLALFLVSGFVGPSVGRLTCRGGKNPVRSFHTRLLAEKGPAPP